MGKILVLGATGSVGQATVENLAKAGASVRAATRHPEKASFPAGVEAVRFKYTAPETFGPALAGVDSVFLLTPPGADSYSLAKAFVEAATKQVKKIVVMTASGVEFNPEAPLRKIELAVEKSGVKYVFLRPNWFMDNFNTYWIAPIQQAGVIPVPAADSKSAFIDTRDIGAVAAAVLTTDKYDGQGLTISGSESLTYGEAAAILAVAEANAQAIQKIGQAIRTEGGVDAVNLKVAEEYVSAFGNLAKQGNTLIVPGNMGDLSTMIASALTIVKQQRPSA